MLSQALDFFDAHPFPSFLLPYTQQGICDEEVQLQPAHEARHSPYVVHL